MACCSLPPALCSAEGLFSRGSFHGDRVGSAVPYHVRIHRSQGAVGSADHLCPSSAQLASRASPPQWPPLRCFTLSWSCRTTCATTPATSSASTAPTTRTSSHSCSRSVDAPCPLSAGWPPDSPHCCLRSLPQRLNLDGSRVFTIASKGRFRLPRLSAPQLSRTRTQATTRPPSPRCRTSSRRAPSATHSWYGYLVAAMLCHQSRVPCSSVLRGRQRGAQEGLPSPAGGILHRSRRQGQPGSALVWPAQLTVSGLAGSALPPGCSRRKGRL